MFKRQFKRALFLSLSLILFSSHYRLSVSAQTESASRPRQAENAMTAEATITLNEQFFNSFLDVMFRRLRGPQFPLSLARAKGASGPTLAKADAESVAFHPSGLAFQNSSNVLSPGDGSGQCASVIVLEREVAGVRTAVRFENGRIDAPLAFTGSYSVALLGCIRFQGWAETNIRLDFDRARQVLSARVEVRDIHLSGVPGLASGVVVGLVQDSIDRKVNPVEILQAGQLSARVPIAASGGALRLLAKEVRPEIVPGALRLHISYDFVPVD